MQEKEVYRERVETVCKDIGLDPKLMSAIIEVESSWDPWAVRYEPLFSYLSKPNYWANVNRITEASEKTLQKFSWGLGQIMGGTARNLGMTGPITSLCDVGLNIFWCGTYLKRLMIRYPETPAFISAYNAGSPTGANQDYVKKVMTILKP